MKENLPLMRLMILRVLLLLFLILPGAGRISAQIQEETFTEIPQGTFEFKLYFSEWGGRMDFGSCTVTIHGNQITVKQNEKTKLTGGEVLAEGILMEHQSGKWIIAKSDADKYAEEIGGCTGGPVVVDLERKIVEWC